MRTRNWLTVVSCLVGVMGCGGKWPKPDGRDGQNGQPRESEEERRARCQRTHFNWGPSEKQLKYAPRVRDRQASTAGSSSTFGFVSSSSASQNVFAITTDCPRAGGCGLNGSWLGSGVQFRSLHLTAGVPNEQGLQIREFRKGAELLRIDVRGQELLGYRPNGGVLAGPALIGAQLFVDHVVGGKVDRTYTVTIEGLPTTPPPPPPPPAPVPPDYTKFWTKCDDPGCVATPRLYAFSAVSSDGCEVRLCKPGLADDYAGGLKGTAVIFRGDLYKDSDYSVQLEAANTFDGDVFNIACLGTSISKLHLMRHTSATGNPANLTSVDQRTTMLKLFAADYCGIGVPFTEDGLPLSLGFDNASYPLLPASHYPFATGDTVDAAWTKNGAACIGASRALRIAPPSDILSLVPGPDASSARSQINNVCKDLKTKYPASQVNIPDCATTSPGPVTTANPFILGNYATSGNPGAR